MAGLTEASGISRRRVFSVVSAFATALAARKAFSQGTSGSRTLVALFTRTGNTRVVADLVRREYGADFFEIVTQKPYPSDYEKTVEQASREREGDYLPPLAATVAEFSRYEAIYLAFPIWGMSTPPPVRSFVSAHEFGVKRIIPLITHGGYGTGDALDVVARYAPDARIAEPFVMEGEQERNVIDRVSGWMNG